MSDIYFSKILEFYKLDYNNLNTLLDIIQHRKDIPLRLIEWFVTNYSKKYNIIYKFKKNGKYEIFEVFTEYRIQLKNHNKKHFDPFCRGPTLTLSYIDKNTQQEISFITAYRQLNFFKWAIENRIIDYIDKHFQNILTDMIKYKPSKSTISTLSNSDTDSKNSKKKKNELSVPSYITFNVITPQDIEELK